MLEGNQIYLCPVEKEDLEQFRFWRNQRQFRKYFREYREIGKDSQLKWYENSVLNNQSIIMFSIRMKHTNELLGCCGLCYINWIHRNADLSLYIGWENSYIDDKGYAEEACKLLFDYGFNELGLKRIWTEIYEFDEAKYGLYTKLGMQQDGLLRCQYFYEGKWWDSRIMSIISNE